MMDLKCSSCGHEIERDEAALAPEIPCPRCGKPMPTSAAADTDTDSNTRKFEKPLPSPADPGGASIEPVHAPTRKLIHEDNTVAASASAQGQLYPYLAPSKAPGEIGFATH